MSNNRRKLVPQCSKALESMKYEIAAEIGIVPSGSLDLNSEFADELGGQAHGHSHNIDWGSVSSRNNGYIGGSITKRLIEQAQKSILNLN